MDRFSVFSRLTDLSSSRRSVSLSLCVFLESPDPPSQASTRPPARASSATRVSLSLSSVTESKTNVVWILQSIGVRRLSGHFSLLGYNTAVLFCIYFQASVVVVVVVSPWNSHCWSRGLLIYGRVVSACGTHATQVHGPACISNREGTRSIVLSTVVRVDCCAMYFNGSIYPPSGLNVVSCGRRFLVSAFPSKSCYTLLLLQ